MVTVFFAGLELVGLGLLIAAAETVSIGLALLVGGLALILASNVWAVRAARRGPDESAP